MIGVQHFKSYNLPRITTTFVSMQKKSLTFSTLHFKNYNLLKNDYNFCEDAKKILDVQCVKSCLKYSHVVIFTKGSSLVTIMIPWLTI
jgi:hypothetical protein